MKIIELDQNTAEWLEARKSFIGGSDLASIMCVSPWRTVFQLWEEKLGICTPDHAEKAFIFEKGHRLEIIARNSYEKRLGYEIPSQVVQHSSIPWARVSLDCFNLDHRFVGEVKFMGAADWLLLKHDGVVPHHYYPQIQYQLLCTGFTHIHFIGINKRKHLASAMVKADVEYMKKMVRWSDHFWAMVQSKNAPKMTQQDYKFFLRKQGKLDADRIYDIDHLVQRLMAERKVLEESVLKVARSTRMVFQDKILIRVGDFDSDDLSLISDIPPVTIRELGRSLKEDIKLVVIDNNHEDVKGGPNGSIKKEHNKEATTSKCEQLSSNSTSSKDS